ncbi:MAG: hypothetical protein ACP5NQ_05250 [Vulcanisaeta sp.]
MNVNIKINRGSLILILVIILCLEIIFLLINPPTSHYIGELVNGSGAILINAPCGTIVRAYIELTNYGTTPARIYLPNNTVVILGPGQSTQTSLLIMPKVYVLCSSGFSGSIVEIVEGNTTSSIMAIMAINTAVIRIVGDVFIYVNYWVIRL